MTMMMKVLNLLNVWLQLLSATVREDGYELSLTINFALRGGGMPDGTTSYRGLPTGNVRDSFGSQKGVRRSSLTRYASQESLGKFTFHLYIIVVW